MTGTLTSIKAPFRTAYNFLETHLQAMQGGATDAYWEDTCNEAIRLCRESGNNPLTADLLYAGLAELERLAKLQTEP